jgi:hypothetical protein
MVSIVFLFDILSIDPLHLQPKINIVLLFDILSIDPLHSQPKIVMRTC